MSTFYQKIIHFGELFQNFLLLALRLFCGYIFFQAGLGKIQNPKQVIQAFSSLGFPYPEYLAPFVGWVECIGGICLMIGLAARFVSIPLIIVMIVALLTAHKEATWKIFQDGQQFLKQPPFLPLLICLIILSFGPGMFSCDYILQRAFSKKR